LHLVTSPSLPVLLLRHRYATISNQYADAIAKTLNHILKNILLNGSLKSTDVVSENDQKLMASWNPKITYAQNGCIHCLVEAVARVLPNSEAVCAWDGSLSYAELDALSTITAKQLAQIGVARGTYVPFAFEKSLWAVVATLGILKAGGAFVPLDPTDPRARIADIILRTNAKVIATSEVYESYFKDIAETVVVVSQRTTSVRRSTEGHRLYDNGQNAKSSKYLALTAVSPSDPIFILFTSGSTGKPKGIIHKHGAITAHAVAHGEAMGMYGARVLQFAAHTFDVAIMDIFTTLIFGGCICIPSEDDRRTNILGAINNLKVDFAILTPSFCGLLDPSEVPTLKTLAVGGERLTQDRVERWADKVTLIQIYGPAEVGICLQTRMHKSTRADTVGYSLCNSSCWLVDPDDHHRLVPIGAIGELVVTGPSVARGYLHDDKKTSACFLENLGWSAFFGLGGNRFFKTGDLLRYNTNTWDGAFDFIGRKDNQIKLRGQRMEPGEVEYHIAKIPGVHFSVVMQPGSGCFSGELVAVVEMEGSRSPTVRNMRTDEMLSLAEDQPLSLETLKHHVSKALPPYMVPTACLTVNTLPCVPSLKVDRNRVEQWLTKMKSRPMSAMQPIGAPDALRPSLLDPEESIAIEISSRLAEIVARKDVEMSGLLSRHDFAIQAVGIDSIQIMSLAKFLRDRYQTVIPMDTLFSPDLKIRDIAHLIQYGKAPWTFKYVVSGFKPP
jgi:amino acid adenylation domain-containing protein